MAYCWEQIYLDDVTKFKDVTPALLKRIHKDFRDEPEKITSLLNYIVMLAFFYREEVRHPEWYTAQVEAGESQLP